MHDRPQKGTHGFTLVELLVVIAVIAILAAILLPVLASARAKAQQTGCINNTKQMTIVIVMYTTDYNERLVPDVESDVPPNANNTGAWIINLIDFYSKATNLFLCPTTTQLAVSASDTTAGDVVTPWSSTLPRGGTRIYNGSYGYNGWCYSDKNGGGNAGFLPNGHAGSKGYFVKVSHASHPAQSPAFYDQTWTDAWPVETASADKDLHGWANQSNNIPGSGLDTMRRITKARHGAGGGAKAPSNVAGWPVTRLPGNIDIGFLDGHVVKEPLKNLWELYWHAEWTPALIPSNLTAN